jgi:hypothetical protein
MVPLLLLLLLLLTDWPQCTLVRTSLMWLRRERLDACLVKEQPRAARTAACAAAARHRAAKGEG